MKLALFKGCFIPVRLPHIEEVARRVLGDLGVELVEIEGFSCCPEPVGSLADRFTGLAVAARNLSLAEEAGLDVVTLCNGCTYSLRQSQAQLKNPGLRGRVNAALKETGHQYKGSTHVKHFAHVLARDIGLEAIAAKVKKPLTGVRVACHPGCHILSPPEVLGFDDPLDPTVLDGMVRALGAEPVDWDLKTLCCGWTLTNFGDRGSANRLIGAKLAAMREAGADCATVICPQCFYQLDTGQVLAARDLGLEHRTPVVYYLQLLGLAMGYGTDGVHLPLHRARSPAFDEKLREALA